MKINIDNLEFEFKLRGDKKDFDLFPATMILTIGQFKVKGFSVRKTKFEENVNRFVIHPPANRAGAIWIKLFWADKEDWELLSKRALKQFDQEHTDYLIENSIELKNKEQGIDPEAIKF